jgi:hypothetical protein
MVALAATTLDQQISAFNIAGLAGPFVEGAHVVCERIPEADQSDYRPRMLLGRRRERPHRRPKCRYEVPSSYLRSSALVEKSLSLFKYH